MTETMKSDALTEAEKLCKRVQAACDRAYRASHKSEIARLEAMILREQQKERRRREFHALQKLSREERARALKKMTGKLRAQYVEYVTDLERMSVEEYEAMLGRVLTPAEREIFEGRTGKR